MAVISSLITKLAKVIWIVLFITVSWKNNAKVYCNNEFIEVSLVGDTCS